LLISIKKNHNTAFFIFFGATHIAAHIWKKQGIQMIVLHKIILHFNW